MSKAPKRIVVGSDTDLLHVLEEVKRDKIPCLIERDGEVVAAIVGPEDYRGTAGSPKSRLHKKELLSLAGVWRDLDADQLIAEVYKARHEAPPSPPVEL